VGSGASGAGGLIVSALTQTANPVVRLALQGNAETVQLGGIGLRSSVQSLQSGADVFINLGSGVGLGSLDANTLGMIYGGTNGHADFTNSSLVNAQGQIVLGGSVAGITSVGFETGGFGSSVTYTPNNKYQVNSCPITSINCVILTSQLVPAGSPLLQNILGGVLPDMFDDPDFILPSVSDRDY
jgi:hypothetical protein